MSDFHSWRLIYGVDSARGRAVCAQQGFTLLEMVLVLLIMGMVASLSMVFIDNEDSQFRYEESMRKLDVLHDAVVAERRYQDQVLFSGFVVDNGVLPSDMASLIETKPAGWVDYSLVQVRYKTSPVGVQLNKGYREDSIRSGIDSKGEFKDGWGDDFTIATASNDLTLQYSGTGKAEGFDTDVNRDVGEGDWSIALSDINSVTIENRIPILSTCTLPDCALSTDNYKVVFSLFKNSATANPDDQWHTFHTTLDAVDIVNGDFEC